MYSPTTRLLTVLELLQSYWTLSGAELAGRLDVDERTVRRYIDRLRDMGLRIEADRGRGGGYTLQRGDRVPPLVFSATEMTAVFVGLLAARGLDVPLDPAAVEGAIARIERVLPDELLERARGIQRAVRFTPGWYRRGHGRDTARALEILEQATADEGVVHIRHSRAGRAPTERDIEPFGIVWHDGFWYVPAWCRMREAIRTFRVDRISEIRPTSGTRSQQAPADPLQLVLDSLSRSDDAEGVVSVSLRCSEEEARDILSGLTGTFSVETEGWCRFRGTAGSLPWLAIELLDADCPVRVHEPEELRRTFQRLASRAEQIAASSEP